MKKSAAAHLRLRARGGRSGQADTKTVQITKSGVRSGHPHLAQGDTVEMDEPRRDLAPGRRRRRLVRFGGPEDQRHVFDHDREGRHLQVSRHLHEGEGDDYRDRPTGPAGDERLAQPVADERRLRDLVEIAGEIAAGPGPPQPVTLSADETRSGKTVKTVDTATTTTGGAFTFTVNPTVQIDTTASSPARRPAAT